MIGLSIFLAVLLGIAIYLLIELWKEKEDYRKWFGASKKYDVEEYSTREYFTQKIAKEWSPNDNDLIKTLGNDLIKTLVKLNKDGSIAKKRGRPVGSKKK